MKYTIVGPTGRAQLIFQDLTGPNVPARRRRERPEYCVRLLPRRAHRSTSFRAAGDQVYLGSDLETALMHIRAWTGLTDIPLPEVMLPATSETVA